MTNVAASYEGDNLTGFPGNMIGYPFGVFENCFQVGYVIF